MFFAAYFALRTSRAAMTALWYGAVLPAEQWLGRLCGRLTLSVGEVLILTAVFCAILWLANVPRRIIAARGLHWGMALRLTLTALCAVLTVYAGFCLTWGIGYNTDSFQEKSGIHARPSTAETLAEVTAYFAGNLAACADAHDLRRVEAPQQLRNAGYDRVPPVLRPLLRPARMREDQGIFPCDFVLNRTVLSDKQQLAGGRAEINADK